MRWIAIFAVVAFVPLDQIPLMKQVAEISVQAFESRL
jgi:hypothetical protein